LKRADRWWRALHWQCGMAGSVGTGEMPLPAAPTPAYLRSSRNQLPCCLQIFAGPLAGGARAVVLANMQTTQSQYPISNITVLWEQIGLQPGQRCRVRELYAGEWRGRGWVGGREVLGGGVC
jgi:hypothetical protein